LALVRGNIAWSAAGPKLTRLLMALVLPYTVHLAFWEEWRWFALFLLLFLLGLQRRDRSGLLAFGLASVLGGFFLLMKLTIGPGALLTLGAGSLLGRRAPAILSRSAVSIAGAAIGLLAGWVGLYGTTSGLGTYWPWVCQWSPGIPQRRASPSRDGRFRSAVMSRSSYSSPSGSYGSDTNVPTSPLPVAPCLCSLPGNTPLFARMFTGTSCCCSGSSSLPCASPIL
jgi:hypothetical protein